MKISGLLRKFVFGTCGILSTSLIYALDTQTDPPLKVDVQENTFILPKHFRTSLDPLPKNALEMGLRELNIAGSGQFSENELKEALKVLKSCTIVDLRQECHGYLNGIAVSWFGRHNAANYGKKLAEILHEESTRLHNLVGKEVELSPELKRKVNSALTESALAKELGIGYERIPVTDHLTPESDMVDRFLAFVKGHPKGTWLLFHCRGGDGRTSSFMAMYDMMHNAKKVSFEDIIERQWVLGGSDLAHIPEQFNWRSFRKEERYDFLHQFYGFCRANDAEFSKSWSEWLHLSVEK